jgi:hypothetical protein
MVEHTESLSGELSKSATVTTNDPQRGTIYLSLRAYVKPVESADGALAKSVAGKSSGAFTISPNDRWFTSALVGTGVNTTIYLYNRTNNPVHIKKVEPGGSSFRVSLSPIQDGKRYEIAVSTDPALKPGQYSQVVRLTTDSKETPEVVLHLNATVLAKVFVTPSTVTMPKQSLNTDLASLNIPLIYVRKVRETGLKLKSVRSTLPFLNLEVKTETEGQFYTIRVSIDKSKISGPGEFKGEIQVETNDPEVPAINIPVEMSFSQD